MSWIQPTGAETKDDARNLQELTPHHLNKYNLDCGCHICKASKYYGKYKHDEKERKKRKGIENSFY